jgi:hypothetical protein
MLQPKEKYYDYSECCKMHSTTIIVFVATKWLHVVASALWKFRESGDFHKWKETRSFALLERSRNPVRNDNITNGEQYDKLLL